jgi:hypothetical protein
MWRLQDGGWNPRAAVAEAGGSDRGSSSSHSRGCARGPSGRAEGAKAWLHGLDGGERGEMRLDELHDAGDDSGQVQGVQLLGKRGIVAD